MRGPSYDQDPVFKIEESGKENQRTLRRKNFRVEASDSEEESFMEDQGEYEIVLPKLFTPQMESTHSYYEEDGKRYFFIKF